MHFFEKKKKIFYESPWLFLLSTASLFLTLGAVMFFHFFVQRLEYNDAELMISVSVTVEKMNKIFSKIISTIVGFIASSTIVAYISNFLNKHYNFLIEFCTRELFGDIKINSENYPQASLVLLNGLSYSYKTGNLKDIYDLWAAINLQVEFSKNNTKLTNAINFMTNKYNLQLDINNKHLIASDTGFLQHMKVVDLCFIPYFNNKVEDFIFKYHNGYITILWYDRFINELKIFNVDCKKTAMDSLTQKLKYFELVDLNKVENHNAIYGCNLYLLTSILEKTSKIETKKFITSMLEKNSQSFTDNGSPIYFGIYDSKNNTTFIKIMEEFNDNNTKIAVNLNFNMPDVD